MKNAKDKKKNGARSFFWLLFGELLGERLGGLLMLAIGTGLFLLGSWVLPDMPDMFEDSLDPDLLVMVGCAGALIFMAILSGIFKMFQKKIGSLKKKDEATDEASGSQTEMQSDMTHENRIDL